VPCFKVLFLYLTGGAEHNHKILSEVDAHLFRESNLGLTEYQAGVQTIAWLVDNSRLNVDAL
jgi:hypothetical protein